MFIRIINILLVILIVSFCNVRSSIAFWIWTPETNKWENPKYSVRDTPSEQLEYGLGFYESKQYPEAIREFKKLIKHYPKSKEAPKAQFYIGQCMEDQDKLFEAFKEYQIVVDKYPFSELSGQIVKKQYDIGVAMLEGKNTRGKFMQALAGTDYNVIEVFRGVIKNAPYGELAAVSQYKIGLYLLEKQLYQEARDEFEKTLNDYPESEWAKAAKYQIAVSDAKRSTDAQYDQKVTQAAVAEFKEFVEGNPDAELSQQAKEQIKELKDKEAENAYLVAEFYEKQKNFAAAKIYYQAVVDDFATTRWASRALIKIRQLSAKVK